MELPIFYTAFLPCTPLTLLLEDSKIGGEKMEELEREGGTTILLVRWAPTPPPHSVRPHILSSTGATVVGVGGPFRRGPPGRAPVSGG